MELDEDFSVLASSAAPFAAINGCVLHGFHLNRVCGMEFIGAIQKQNEYMNTANGILLQ